MRFFFPVPWVRKQELIKRFFPFHYVTLILLSMMLNSHVLGVLPRSRIHSPRDPKSHRTGLLKLNALFIGHKILLFLLEKNKFKFFHLIKNLLISS